MNPQFDLCIIPAAGEATRMGEMCKDKPKCLLEVRGKPILAHILDYWCLHVRNFVTVLSDAGATAVENNTWSHDLLDSSDVVVQPKPRGLTNAILCALRQVRVPEQFLVVLGDCLVEGAFEWDYTYLGAHGIGIADGDQDFARSYAVGRCGNIRVDRVIEKPKMGMGVYLLNWKCLRALEQHLGLTEAIDELAQTQTVVPIPFTGRYLNVTYPEDLKRW